jgi:hypothetical protein
MWQTDSSNLTTAGQINALRARPRSEPKAPKRPKSKQKRCFYGFHHEWHAD